MKLTHLILCKVHFQQRKKNKNAIASQGFLATATLCGQRGQFEVGEQLQEFSSDKLPLKLLDFLFLLSTDSPRGIANLAVPILALRGPVW